MLIKQPKFKFIKPTDPEYSQELMLRWEVLRKPLGMPPGSEVFSDEAQSMHLVAIDKKKVVGCVLFHPESPDSGRIYQMAVSEEYQGRGFGRKLLAFLEKELIKKGIKTLHLYSREESLGFYLQRGYHPIGVMIEKMGISHQPMEKLLH
jgi:ribosomal protein S18 acetylase RimI-like enzyme